MYSATLYWCWIWENVDLLYWYSVLGEFLLRIDTRSDNSLAMFIEKVIIFPTNFAKYLKIFHPDNFQISFICYIGMKCTDSRNTQNLTKHYCLPPKYKLCMKMNNIWLKSTDSLNKSWSKSKCNLKIWIEKCRKSLNRKYLNTRIMKFGKSWIIGDNNQYFVTSIS